jgi:pyrimidine-nucleoside phosphorylase
MLARRLIGRKRDGGRIESGEWRALVTAYTAGQVPDHQMAALLMAIYLRGLDADETAALTTAMLHSGAVLDLSHLPAPRVDKHSTGGVGDKVSLVLAPLMAAAGVVVPMISGRALGHTGGTADKLESIPGFRTDLPLAHARAQLERVGCVMMAQTAEIAPADRRIYALRDATATVESLPLIAASIMSKKLAEGLTGLVLDVKHGSGAFIPDVARGLELAESMIALGKGNGVPVVALMTAMDQPLGRACGNALETEEAIHALTGNGPPDLIALTVALGIEMLLVAGVVETEAEGRARLEEALASGAAARKFQEVIGAQGGNPAVVDDPSLLPQAAECELFTAPRSGVVVRIEPREIGRGVIALGGGRTNADDVIDPTVGFVIGAKAGDWVDGGEPLATIFARDRAGVKEGRAVLRRAIVVGDEAPRPLPLITHRVTERGVERYDVESRQ